jgi:hypothetical protein
MTPEERKTVAAARLAAQALNSPVADFSDEDMANMRTLIKDAEKVLTKGTGVKAEGGEAPPEKAKKAKTPVEYLRLNYPSFPETPANIKWAEKKMKNG